jgi:hypothetical protein
MRWRRVISRSSTRVSMTDALRRPRSRESVDSRDATELTFFLDDQVPREVASATFR